MLLTPPTGQVVTAVEAMLAARVDGPDVAPLFDGYVASATAIAEQELGRRLLQQDWRVELPGWGPLTGVRKGLAVVGFGPVQAVQAVRWWDGAAWQVLALSQCEVLHELVGARMVPVQGVTWPVVAPGDGYRVQVDVRVGYQDAAKVPECVKQYIKAMAAYWFRHPMAAVGLEMQKAPHLDRLLDPERSWSA